MFPIFQSPKTTGAFSLLVKHIDKPSLPSAGLMSPAYSWNLWGFFFQISNQSSWQVSGVSCASHTSMNHSCCLAHSCLGASGSRRYEVGQMEGPHGSSRCFAFVYAQLIKNIKPCHPRVCAICGGVGVGVGGSRQQLLVFPGC